MNVPGAFEGCFEEFGHGFGGDGMCTKCAIKLTSNVTFEAEPLLHQLDIRDEAHGLFQDLDLPSYIIRIPGFNYSHASTLTR